MRSLAMLPVLIAAFVLAATARPAVAQSAFKVPYNFESGGKKFAAGSYVVTKSGEGQVTLHQVSTGKETSLPFTATLKPGETTAGTTPDAPPPGAQLVFDEVGNFEPSYTEYFTVYVLAEVWLSGQDGYLVHTTKGAHKTRVVRGEPVKKEPPRTRRM
jgi:hypothetical protein